MNWMKLLLFKTQAFGYGARCRVVHEQYTLILDAVPVLVESYQCDIVMRYDGLFIRFGLVIIKPHEKPYGGATGDGRFYRL